MVPFYSGSDYAYKDCKQEQETTGNGEADGRLKQEHVLKSELAKSRYACVEIKAGRKEDNKVTLEIFFEVK